MSKFRAPIGISDFKTLRESAAYYVDKTQFVARVVDEGAQVLLFARPRRFGKTLNMSALRYFLEKTGEERAWMFEDLAVWRAPEARQHFQRHPMVFLSFKDAKERNWPDAFYAIRLLVAEAFKRHRHLLDDPGLTPEDRDAFQTILRAQGDAPLYATALRALSEHLARHHGERVAILIDEYDTPILAGHARGYFDEVVTFFRGFLSAGFKDNPSLFKGVLTGVLRIAKESIFSGLNNLEVHTVLSRQYSTAFGFTQEEVDALCNVLGVDGARDQIRAWYDGYLFAGSTIYNPWSVLSYAKNHEDGCRPYWVSTGSEDVLRELVLDKGQVVAEEMQSLLGGRAIDKPVEEHVTLREVAERPEAVWSLLLMSGYLTCRRTWLDAGQVRGELAVPNVEVRYAFQHGVSTWVEAGLGGSERVDALARAMLAGNDKVFGRLLSDLVLKVLSYHDTGGREPERVFQAFVLGMLVHLEGRFEVRSNRESGEGRYDVAVLPKQAGQPGVVVEIKQVDETEGETVEQALETALRQIRERGYTAELEARGATPILEYGVVFDGKRVWVRR
jgi:hypothetical protein